MTGVQVASVGPRISGFFAPRSVALVGVSAGSNWSDTVLDGLSTIGFDGDVHLVSSRSTHVRGRPTCPSMEAVGAPIDLAYLLVPRAAVPDAVADAKASGVRDIVVLASGYREAGPNGAASERDLGEVVGATGLRMLGPNALGFVNYHEKIALFPPLVRHPPVRPGPVAMVSQSGGVAAEILDLFSVSGLGLSLLASTGNEVDIDVADVLDYLVDDPGTEVVCLFLEAIRRPQRFLAAARRALAAAKPVVAIKVGRSSAGARSVTAHTGAIVGDDRAVGAALRSAGVVRVDTPEQLVAVAGLAVRSGGSAGPGLAALGISGGACSLIADAAERHGVALADLGPDTLTQLEQLLPEFGRANNPLDVTGAVISRPAILADALRIVRNDPSVGLVLCQMPLPEQESPAVAEMLSTTAAAAAPGGSSAPVVVCPGTGVGLSAAATALVDRHRLPVLSSSFDLAVSACGAVSWWSGRRRAFRAAPVSAPAGPVVSGPGPGQPAWSELAAREFLADNGIPMVPAEVARTADEAVRMAEGFGYPVVVKAVSPHLPHKTEVGGVHLDLIDAEAVQAAFSATAAVLADLGQPPVALVAPMRSGGLELLVGVVRDPVWGLLFAVGLGGIWTEVLDDVSVRLLPVTRADVEEMLDRLRGRTLFRGLRGQRATDVDALVDVLLRVGALACSLGPRLESLELNPLRVDGAVFEALDAAISWTDEEE